MKVYQRLAGNFVAEGVTVPTLVDVRLDRSVITLPYRRIHYGRDD